MDTLHVHIDAVREYALIRTGEHPKWKGDRILNSEGYAWRIGYEYPGDADCFAQSLADAEREYCLLTGLSPRGVQIMAREIKRGAMAALAEAQRDGRV